MHLFRNAINSSSESKEYHPKGSIGRIRSREDAEGSPGVKDLRSPLAPSRLLISKLSVFSGELRLVCASDSRPTSVSDKTVTGDTPRSTGSVQQMHAVNFCTSGPTTESQVDVKEFRG